jgi:hypothetical protein
MLELAGTLVVFGILMTTFLGLIDGMKRMQLHFAQESQAILVLDNVVGRLPADDAVSKQELQTVLDEEFAAADLPRKHELQAALEATDDGVRLAIRDKRRPRRLASVEVPYDEQ